MIEQKQYNPAIAKLEGILQRSPDSEKVRFYLGALYEEIKNYRAAKQIQKMIRGFIKRCWYKKLRDHSSTLISKIYRGFVARAVYETFKTSFIQYKLIHSDIYREEHFYPDSTNIELNLLRQRFYHRTECR